MRALTCLLLALCLILLVPPAQAATEPAPAREGMWPLAPRPAIASQFRPAGIQMGCRTSRCGPGRARGPGCADLVGGHVTFAATLAGRGVVVVDHGSVRTTYEPVSASVRVGQQVGRGARIGTLQRAADHCFPQACLHWGLLQSETYLDPLSLVGAGPIRLLPLNGSVGGWHIRAAGLGLPSEPTARSPASAPLRPAGGPAGRPGAAGRW